MDHHTRSVGTPGVPPLPSNFAERNGQGLNNPESPIDGQFIPDINTGAQSFPPYVTAAYAIRVK